jgi:hypothetical protein
VASLLESADARCKFVLESFPGSPYARKAEDLLRRIGEERGRLLGATRAGRAKELLGIGRKHLEARRYRLARLYLRMVTDRFADLREIAGEAARDAELVERQIEKEAGS